jgi:prevent-host-death family protein
MKTTISKATFKPKVLAYLRLVEETGNELIVTDHGRPAVRIIPFKSRSALDVLKELKGSIVSEGEDYSNPVVEYSAWSIFK